MIYNCHCFYFVAHMIFLFIIHSCCLDDNILSTLCLFLLKFGNNEVDKEDADQSHSRKISLKIGGIGDVGTLPKVCFYSKINFWKLYMKHLIEQYIKNN